MTPEERFEKIERNLAQIAESLGSYVTATNTGMQAVTASQIRLNETVLHLTESIDKYVTAADKRMAETEANQNRLQASLDNLIRIITAEHKNGKSST